jgi:hypothetical protein
MEDMQHLQKLDELYSSLNASEQYGIRYGLFPARIQETMRKHHISASDLMEYDDLVRTMLW